MEFSRILNISALLNQKSFFLFGARSTGKTTLIRHQLKNSCTVIDLLETDTFLRLSQEPSYLEKMVAAEGKNIVVIDEVQKIPLLRMAAIASDFVCDQKGAQRATEGTSPRLFSLHPRRYRFRSSSLRGSFLLRTLKEPTDISLSYRYGMRICNADSFRY